MGMDLLSWVNLVSSGVAVVSKEHNILVSYQTIYGVGRSIGNQAYSLRELSLQVDHTNLKVFNLGGKVLVEISTLVDKAFMEK